MEIDKPLIELETIDLQRKKAAAAMVKYGTVQDVAAATRQSMDTIRQWMVEPEWERNVALARLAQMEKTDAMLSQGIDKAVEAVNDRLEQGDIIGIDKDGNEIRAPIKGRDAAIIAAILVDKRNLLRGQPTAIRGSDKKLNALADALRKAVMSGSPQALPITDESGN